MTANRHARVLVLGYGNPGRLDDGLGPAFAEAVAALALPGVTVDSDYQLQPEDALAIAEHDVVVFADASVSGPATFSFERVVPRGRATFTTHSASPDALLALARETFGARTEGFVLGIRGRRFDGFGERLSAEARENLRSAVRFLAPRLASGAFADALTADGEGRDD